MTRATYFMLAFLAMLTVIAAFVSMQSLPVRAATFGCCVPDTPIDCFDSATAQYSTQQQFFDACRAAMFNTSMADAQVRSHILGSGTCAPYRAAGEKCEIGCCCNTAENPSTGDFTTNATCSVLHAADPLNNPREFRSSGGLSCEQVCGGSPTVPSTRSYTISGTVTNEDGPVRGATVYFNNVNNAIASNPTLSDGKFSVHNVPEGTQVLVAVPGAQTPTCRPKSVTVTSTSNAPPTEIVITCATGTCEAQAPSINALSLLEGKNVARFTIGFTDACGTLAGFDVQRCERVSGALDASTCATRSAAASEYIDELDKESTEYCYTVTARQESGTGIASQPACITSAAAECLDGKSGAWCGLTSSGAPGRLSCGANNQLTETACGTGQVCQQYGKTAECLAAPSCEECAGALGLFAKLPLSIPFGATSVSCQVLRTTGVPASRCYDDTARLSPDGSLSATIAKSVNACAHVRSCASYASQGTCVANPCAVRTEDGAAERCAWVPLVPELGIGVCSGATKPACDACGALGTCTRDVCEAISDDCYFDELDNGLLPDERGYPRCLAKEDMACRYYDTRADCIGAGTAAVFDIRYAGDTRSGGTHARTTASADAMSIGSCTWETGGSAGGYCIKNADNYHDPTQPSREDDCIELGVFQTDPSCVVDATPPVTSFALRSPALYGKHEIASIVFSAKDDTTPVDQIVTLFCISQSTCYPNMEFGKLDLSTLTNGTYRLRYSSQDMNGNIEPVGEHAITIVDLGYATLEKVDIAAR
jgi:hypothetical protein